MNEPQPPAGFPTTHWSRVARAGDSTALAELCEAYWYPIYALIRRKGHQADRALDLTQSYFARLIEKGTISAADPARGRFRAFLKADCTFFLADARDHDRALKRGGAVQVLSIDSDDAENRFRHEPAHDDTPERRFERDWAVLLIDRAMGRLERHYQASGRGEAFRSLKPTLTGEPEAARFAQLTNELNTTEGALRTAVHRLRARFADELRLEIAETLDDPTLEAIADELRDLFAALGN
jgi:DNA-directed RNA polymerase specialized sigma24 family protein